MLIEMVECVSFFFNRVQPLIHQLSANIAII